MKCSPSVLYLKCPHWSILSQREHSSANTLISDSGLQNCKGINFCYYKQPNLWECVTAALGNEYTLWKLVIYYGLSVILLPLYQWSSTLQFSHPLSRSYTQVLFSVQLLHSSLSDWHIPLSNHPLKPTLLAYSLNYSHHYFSLLFLFTTSLLLSLVLSSFSLTPKISWSSLPNSFAPLSFITLTWQTSTLAEFKYSLSLCLCLECWGLLKMTWFSKLAAQKTPGYQTQLALKPGPSHCSAILLFFSRQLTLQTFCIKPIDLLPSLPPFFLFKAIWVLPLNESQFLISIFNTNPFHHISNFHTKPSLPSPVSLPSPSPRVRSHQHLNKLKSFILHFLKIFPCSDPPQLSLSLFQRSLHWLSLTFLLLFTPTKKPSALITPLKELSPRLQLASMSLHLMDTFHPHIAWPPSGVLA